MSLIMDMGVSYIHESNILLQFNFTNSTKKFFSMTSKFINYACI